MTVMLIGEEDAPEGRRFPVPSPQSPVPVPMPRFATCLAPADPALARGRLRKTPREKGTFLVLPHVCPGRALVGRLALGGCGNALGAGARLER